MSSEVDKQTMDLVLTEVAALRKLEHENVLKIVHSGQGEYTKPSGKKRAVNYIAIELAQGGELFDYVCVTGRFHERMARYFFK
jgi:carbon catabolite-derepressing protein kinase